MWCQNQRSPPSISQILVNIWIAWGFCRKADSGSVSLEKGLRGPVSNKLPGNVEAAESRPHSVVAVSVLQLDGGGGFRRDPLLRSQGLWGLQPPNFLQDPGTSSHQWHSVCWLPPEGWGFWSHRAASTSVYLSCCEYGPPQCKFPCELLYKNGLIHLWLELPLQVLFLWFYFDNF